MKKTLKLTFIVFFALMTNNTFAQIPNAGFENWETIGNSIEPTGWYSFYSLIDSSGSYYPVTKSTDHYPANIGTYSARITNNTSIWNTGISPGNLLGWGMLTSTQLDDKPLFPVTGHPIALCGYYKFIPQNGDTMNIDFNFYNNGVEITRGLFQSNVAATNWTSFKVFVDDTLYSIVDSARISFSACNEPKNGSLGPLGNSVLYIDNLSFDNLLTTSIPKNTFKNTLFSFYPNPASDFVTFNFDNANSVKMTLTIYDIIGELISSETLLPNQKQINVRNLSAGIYMVEIKSEHWSKNQKLIIRR